MLFLENLSQDSSKDQDEESSTISRIPIFQEDPDTKMMGSIEAKMRASLSNLGQRTFSSMTLNKEQLK